LCYLYSMRSHDLVRIARDRAGLTQQQLATRCGRPRETIARWESGSQIPSLDALSALVAACELDLALKLTKRDTTLLDRVEEQLAQTPSPNRLSRLLPPRDVRDIAQSLRRLADARTPTIVVGQIGAALLGAPQRPDSTQVEFVSEDPAATARELRDAGLMPVDVDDRWRDADVREPWALPAGGTLALARNLPGSGDYRDLKRSASRLDFDAQTSVLVAHPRDLLRIADASTRESERARVPGLQAVLDANHR
jgi:transcriptional regulator with XRE-family HTH domain